MNRFFGILSAGLMVLASPCWAQDAAAPEAGTAPGLTLDAALEIITDHGFSGEIVEGAELAANVDIGTQSFALDGYNCTQEGACTEFLFSIGYDLVGGFSFENANEWNSTRLAGRAYRDEEGNPWLDLVIAVGGKDDESAFLEGFLLWLDAVASFEEFIFPETPSS